MNKTKPQFKRFEMHGNLPAALQHGTVVSASKSDRQNRKEVDRQTMRTEFESKRALDGGATISKYPKEYELYKEV